MDTAISDSKPSANGSNTSKRTPRERLTIVKKEVPAKKGRKPNKGRTPKAVIEAKENERDREIHENALENAMRILFNNDGNLNDEDIINLIVELNKLPDDNTKGGKKTANPSSALSHVLQLFKDKVTIDELKDYVTQKRGTKEEVATASQPQQPQQQDDSAMAILPFLMNLQNQGGDVSNMDPNMLTLIMGLMSGNGNNNQNSGLAKLMFNMMMMKMFQPQPQPQQNGNGNNSQQQSQQPNLNAEMLNQMFSQLQQVMQQPQKPAIDPTIAIIASMMKKESNTNNQQGEVAMLLSKMNEIMANNKSNDQMMVMNQMQQMSQQQQQFMSHLVEKTNQALYSIGQSNNPKQDMVDYFQLFHNMQGNQRAKTKDDLEHEYKMRQLDLQREDQTLKRQMQMEAERREAEKKDVWVDLSKQLLGEGGIGNIIGSISGAMAKPKSSGAVQPPPLDLSNDDLDFL